MRILIESFTKRFGKDTVIDGMNLEVEDGEMLALLGPSGCGKSTTLFAVCGLHVVDEGRILFGDEDVTGWPPQRRNVGVVFQSYALYPHMTVFDNVAFPLQVKREAGAAIRRRVDEITALLEIGHLLERLPAHLSGGQQQRVALARALIRRPGVLLLDEPLANLDARLRLDMRSEIRRLQQETGITAILVTHDQVEAMSMCDRIAIMDRGHIRQIASPAEMYRNPANTFVAGFLGNPPIAFLPGRVRDGRFRLDGSAEGVDLPGGYEDLEDGREIRLGVRPEHVRPADSGPLSGKVGFVETHGRENLYDVILDGGHVLRSIQPVRDDIAPGQIVRCRLDTERLLVFDRDGARL